MLHRHAVFKFASCCLAASLSVIGLMAYAASQAPEPMLMLAQADASSGNTAQAENKTDWSTATIKKVDATKRRLLLSHGPIPNLGMSGMTMGFEVTAGIDLTGLNAGDSILFRADQIKGQYTVTEIRKP